MAGPWEKYQTTDQSGPWAKYQQPAEQPAQPKQDSPGFFSGLREYLVDPMMAVGEAFKGVVSGNPVPAAQLGQAVYNGAVTQPGQYLQRTADAVGRGDFKTAIHETPGIVPLFGPMAMDISDDIEHGRYGQAGGKFAGLVTPAAAEATIAKAKVVAPKLARRFIPNVNNAVEEAALQSIEPDVQMSVGQRTGQAGLQRVEQGMTNFPGSATRAHEFFSDQAEQLGNKGRAMAATASPVATDAVGAGEAFQQRLGQRINRLKAFADRQYEDVRTATAANTQTVQTGQTTSPIVGPNGQAITTPVTQTLETPVDLNPIRASLKPIYDDLNRAMPEARRAASPAYAALKNLMESGDQYMNAMDFDKSLGAIKAIARDGNNPFLTSQSQGIAKRIVTEGETQLQTALGTAGADVPVKLKRARNAVKSYYEAGELLGDIADEPARAYQSIVTGGDRMYNTLNDLKRMAPNELKTAGRTFLEGLMDKATAEGGFARADGVMADWRRMGPHTKETLFGPGLTRDLDNFFLAAKRLTKLQNPSGSAHMVAALHGLGAVGTAIGGLVTGNPIVAAGAVGEAFVGPNIAARFLLNSDNAKLLTTALNAPPQSATFSRATATLNARFLALQSEQQQDTK